MPLQLFINELSLPEGACAQEVAAQHLRQLVRCVREASKITSQLVLNAHVPLPELQFGQNWPLSALRNSAGCADESAYLKTLQDRGPHHQTIADLGGPSEAEFEYRLCVEAPVRAGETATSLGLTHAYGGLALSVATHPFWDDTEIAVERQILDSRGEVLASRVIARNAGSATGVVAHREAVIQAVRPAVADGEQLWAERATLFPNLKFIRRTRSQIERLHAGEPVFNSILDRLVGLDRAIDHWRTRQLPHPVYPFHVRPESTSREQLVKWTDDDGIKRIFSDHCEFAPDEGRIHFVRLTAPQRHALVGHVDRKLGIG